MTDLTVRNLKTVFHTERGILRAVDDVSFSIHGESAGIAGESGCGKSTLGLSLLRIVPPPGRIENGSIELDSQQLLSMSNTEFHSKIRWKKLSMIFQGAMNALSPVYTVGEQISEPMVYLGGYSRQEIGCSVQEALEAVGLHPNVAARYPHELSGGMKQRAVIAMALILRPSLVVADEPTTALDLIVQAQIINLLKKLKVESGMSFLLLTHDLSIMSELADRIGVMYAGQMVEWGTAEQVYRNAKHPYTQKLLAAIPTLHGPKRKLESIPGSPPDLITPPSGCRFHPRCPYVKEVCRHSPPHRVTVEDDHSVMCWLYDSG